MRLGCLWDFSGTEDDFARLEALAARGYQYVEVPSSCLRLGDDPDAFYAVRRAWRRAALGPEVVGDLLGPGMLLCGDDVDWRGVERHVALTLERAEELGVRTLVVGSAGARRVPEGYPAEEALDQMRYFLNMAADYAGDLCVAIEPLGEDAGCCPGGLAETAELVRKVGRPAIRLAVDLEHLQDPGLVAQLGALGDLIGHVRVPAAACTDPAWEADLEAFVRTLQRSHYGGRLSVSFGARRAVEDGPVAMEKLRQWLGHKS